LRFYKIIAGIQKKKKLSINKENLDIEVAVDKMVRIVSNKNY
jgi:hypothetical protein